MTAPTQIWVDNPCHGARSEIYVEVSAPNERAVEYVLASKNEREKEARAAAAEHHFPPTSPREGRWYAVLMWIYDGDARHLNGGELGIFPPLAALILSTAERAAKEEREQVCAHVTQLRDEYADKCGRDEEAALDRLLGQLACGDHVKGDG